MAIYNDTTVDRDEDRQVEEGQARNKRETERRQQRESMKTFEAKLTEKTAHELTTKETAARQTHDLKKSKEEKQSLLDKILGVAKEKAGDGEKAHVKAVQQQQEKAFEDKKSRKSADGEFEEKKADEKKTTQKSDTKKSEMAEEGHRRVVEKGQEQGGGGAGSGGGSSDGSSGQQGSSTHLGGQSQGQSERELLKKGVGKEQFTAQMNQTVSKTKFQGQGGFQQNSKPFTPKDLDEIVSAVQLGFNEQGEQEFSIQLSDKYYEGLKVVATRAPEGVVIRFECPNVSVRSTFLKCRVQLYLQFKAKKIAVARIDIV